MIEWVKVTDKRKPKDFTTILVYPIADYGHEVLHGYYLASKDCFYVATYDTEGHTEYEYKPTHIGLNIQHLSITNKARYIWAI